jgi:hypothetical protein
MSGRARKGSAPCGRLCRGLKKEDPAASDRVSEVPSPLRNRIPRSFARTCGTQAGGPNPAGHLTNLAKRDWILDLALASFKDFIATLGWGLWTRLKIYCWRAVEN